MMSKHEKLDLIRSTRADAMEAVQKINDSCAELNLAQKKLVAALYQANELECVFDEEPVFPCPYLKLATEMRNAMYSVIGQSFVREREVQNEV